MNDGFYTVDNVFTEEKRQQLINDFKPFLVDGKRRSLDYNSNNYDANRYQEGFEWFKVSHPTIHLVPQFKESHQHLMDVIKKECGLDLEVGKSWVNLSKGKRKKVEYHTHYTNEFPSRPDFSCVYYLKIPFPFFSNGTLFKDYGLVKAKQNSLMLFNPALEHSTPSSPFPFERYVWAMDLNIKKDLVNGSNE